MINPIVNKYLTLLAFLATVYMLVHLLTDRRDFFMRSSKHNTSVEHFHQILIQTENLPTTLPASTTENTTSNQQQEPSIIGPNSDVAEDVEDETILLPSTLALLKNAFKCKSREFDYEIYQRGDYWVLKNYVKADHGELECYEDVTFVTHGDFTYMEDLEALVTRWLGPISFSLYAPGDDFDATVDSIKYMRDCSKEKDLIRQWVSFHVYFPKEHTPHKVFMDDFLQKVFNCSSNQVPFKVNNSSTLYKQKNKLIYPVNVGRNIARDAALTHYFLSLDIELYPNRRLGNIFLNMLARNISLINREHPSVFVMKPFEVREDQLVPENKTQLIEMLRKKTAIPFHQSMCPNCHKTPHESKWMSQGQTRYMEITGVGKRTKQFQSWEPLFISTHSIPRLEERLSWEGKRDKMTQTYVLCVLDYEFMVLSNAFVTHHPGIKVYHPDHARDIIAAKQNHFIDRVLSKELKAIYGSRQGCKL